MRKRMLLLLLSVPILCLAQQFAVKKNLLYDFTSKLNLDMEFRLSPHCAMGICDEYNSLEWKSNRQMKYCMVQPEAHYRFCEALSRHFLAARLLGGVFNIADSGIIEI